MANRLMIDGINWQAVIARCRQDRAITIAAGYVDGHISQWPPQAWADLAMIPDVIGVRITVAGGTAGDVADCEPGDLGPAAAAGWARNERASGRLPFPVIYVDRNEKPLVIAECRKLGLLLGMSYGLWVATLDGTIRDLDGSDLTRQPGVVAVQDKSEKQTGGPWDESIVTGKWPVPPPPSWVTVAASMAADIQADVNQLADFIKGHV